MKFLLIMLIVGICAIGLRSPEIMHAVGLATSAQDPAISFSEKAAAGQKPMTAEEFAELSRKDPQAYQKYINSFQIQERGEVDKLLNFLSRGKYE